MEKSQNVSVQHRTINQFLFFLNTQIHLSNIVNRLNYDKQSIEIKVNFWFIIEYQIYPQDNIFNKYLYFITDFFG